jgi:hypothetical protein
MSDIDELHKKIDRVDTRLDDNNRILDRLTISVELHEARTTASETRITTLENENLLRKANSAAWLKFGAFLVGFSTVVGVVFEILHRL